MFCDTCHWYTAGKAICPHCGARQKSRPAKDMFNLPGDISVLDDAFMNAPLVDAPMPAIEASSQKPVFQPPPVPPAQPRAHRFCGRCGARAGGGRFCAACGAPLNPLK